jgi:molecular chaperone DnaK
VVFEVSNECLLKVRAREGSSGKEVSSTFTTRDTPEAVKARIAKETQAAAEAAPAARDGTTVAMAPPAAVVASGGGILGWVKRLFIRP